MTTVANSSMAISPHKDYQVRPRSPSPDNGPLNGNDVKPRTGSSDYSEGSSVVSSPEEDPRRSSMQTTHSNGDQGHKRKRSDENERNGTSPERHYDYTPPKRADSQHMADRALHVLGTNHAQNHYQNGQSNGHHWDRDQPESATTSTPNDDDQHQWDMAGSSGQSYDANGNGQTLPGGQKRKRNFANRTKTGCITCRKRKKKCDEGRPFCDNCKKGQHACGGYDRTKATPWLTPPATKGPIPLQSKGGHSSDTSPNSHRPPYEVGQMRPVPREEHDKAYYQYVAGPHNGESRNRPAYAGQSWPPHQQQQQSQQQQNQQPLPPYTKEIRELPPPAEASHPNTNGNTPIREMQSRQPASAHQPSPPYSQSHPPTAPQQQQQPPPPPPASTSQAPPPSHQAPPPHQAPPSQAPPPHPSYQLPTSTPQTSQPYYAPPKQDFQHYSHPPAPPPAPPTDYPHEYTKPPSTSHSRLSSAGFDYSTSHSKVGGKVFGVEEVERSKMLRHAKYNHFDPTLRNERLRCEEALFRFNQGSRLVSGMEEEEVRNLLWKVFDPSKDSTHHFVAQLNQKGNLSHGVRIEAPFSCTYGYNIRLGDNVYIGKGTEIDDAAKVEIGARTWIGPGVTIMTSECSRDLVERKGSNGLWIAKPVIIGSEVVIGKGAFIYPDVRLERGCTVEPGAIVRESLREGETARAAVGGRMMM